MKLKALNTNKLSWKSPLVSLAKTKKIPSALEKLSSAGISTLEDLLWIFPLRIQILPSLQSFDKLIVDSLFRGIGLVKGVETKKNFKIRGKGRIPLEQVHCTVKDYFSERTITLRWFNAYPNIAKILRSNRQILFSGEATIFAGTTQLINPKINVLNDEQITSLKNLPEELLKEYPTVNKVPGKKIQEYIESLPIDLWKQIPETIPSEIKNKRKLLDLSIAFAIIHGQTDIIPWSKKSTHEAETTLIYYEFFEEQIKILARKNKTKSLQAQIYSSQNLQRYIDLFPYQLTTDQIKTLEEITHDLASGQPMMRLVQGDVGSGKTTIAIIASMIVIENKAQVALMAPTEVLANQHYQTLQKLLPQNIKMAILLGSTKIKDKKIISEKLKNHEIDFIIGTHSLIQDSVSFANLGLAIIDEQHKFGVNQRLKLSSKNTGTHTLIMTATPIPRSLSLTQYGDLDLSIIKTMPANRKGIKTRIVETKNYHKYLDFLMTRLNLGEQIYVVTPAIEESQTVEMENVEKIFQEFCKHFPAFKVAFLHGRMKGEQKTEILQQFSDGNINILISTSVIEVGINVVNATVMSIYSPERFGLSSLHQLRGRVGRGEKPGFCFLVATKSLSLESHNRLSVMETTNDGFVIAEKDLEARGEGNIFGLDQSGTQGGRRIASLIKHPQIFEQALVDVKELQAQQNPFILDKIKFYQNQQHVVQTI